jgi:CheY-like chemotaxis protein
MPDSNNKKVLIVDDNENVLLALEYNLQQAGYLVLKSTSGNDALIIAQSENPDIVVSDVAMPEMDGIEFCKKLRSIKKFSEVPFIFLTAHGEPEERVKGLRSGADDYIVKPFDIEELITRISILYQKIKKRGTISGNLKELSLADTLQIFELTRKEGKLLINSDYETGYISFKNGMIMDASFGNVYGEDALIAMLMLDTGQFNYEPQAISSGSIAKPVSFAMLEALRIIDEKVDLLENIPKDNQPLFLRNVPPPDNPDSNLIIKAVRSGARFLKEIQQASHLSLIRTEIELAKLIKHGYVHLKEIDKHIEPAVKSLGKPLQVLFAFTDELSATPFIKETAGIFDAHSQHGIKAGIADFLKINIADRTIHMFFLRGEKKFSFLWEPMLITSNAAIFFVASPDDLEHMNFFKNKVKASKDIPFYSITKNNKLLSNEVQVVEGTQDIKDFFVDFVDRMIK